jgi:DNA-binding transcriptional regulator YiaG
MTKHNDKPEGEAGEVRVLDGQHRVASLMSAKEERVLDEYDATTHVGLRVTVRNAAIERVDESGEETIELPKPRELRASAAIVRCLMPIKLQGWEIKAMRKIMNLTLADLAKKLDERTAPETVSRWESDAQPMGSYADKVLRLLICEELRKEAPGIEYNAGTLAAMKVQDPWRTNPDYQIRPIVLTLIHIKEQSGSIIETWNDTKLAA